MVIARLLPLIIGASVGCPIWIIVVLLLLRSKRGVAKATAFAAAVVLVRVLQFVLFGRLFGAIASASGEDVFDLIPSTLLLVAGLVLVITAVRTWWREEDFDAPPPKWMTALSGMSILAASGMAVILMCVSIKQWVFTLSAIAVIDDAHLSALHTTLAYVFFILTAQSLMLAPIISSAVAPGHSSRIVVIVLRWLERNNRLITIVVSLAFGAWFLARSSNSLLTHTRGAIPESRNLTHLPAELLPR